METGQICKTHRIDFALFAACITLLERGLSGFTRIFSTHLSPLTDFHFELLLIANVSILECADQVIMNIVKKIFTNAILIFEKTKDMTHLNEGDKAPDFSGVNEKGEAVSLSDFKGKKLILFFYPKADTPGCTAEACSLRDSYADLRAQGFELLGVSADTSKMQNKFKKKYNLPFPLLADTDQKVVSAYGVWGPKQMFGKTFEGINRTTFVINENGLIEKIFTKVETANHAEQILNGMMD